MYTERADSSQYTFRKNMIANIWLPTAEHS